MTHAHVRRVGPLLGLGLTLALLSGALPGCDDGAAEPSPPADAAVAMDGGADQAIPDAAPSQGELSVTPVRVSLLSAIGETATTTLTLRNVGEGPLNVAGLAFEPPVPVFALADVPEGPFVIEPGAERVVQVSYTPTQANGDSGRIVVRSDDADEGELALPVAGRVPEACLQVMPGSIDLGRVQPGQSTGRFRITIANCGDFPITLTDVRLDGAAGFGWESTDGQDPVGLRLEDGGVVSLQVWYDNTDLRPDEVAAGNLIIETDRVDVRPVVVSLTARGEGRQGCVLTLTPERVAFGDVRVGTEAATELTLVNEGLDPCEVRSLAIESPDGPFAYRDGPADGTVIESGGVVTVQATYSPNQATPVGERTNLFINYRDVVQDENRRISVVLIGVGAEALIGADPFDGLDLGEATAPAGCGGPVRVVAVGNVGFVPLSLTGWAFEGDACDRFALLSAPDVPAEGKPLEAMQMEPFTFQFQPTVDDAGELSCFLVALSDAQNNSRLRVRLWAQAVAEAETTQTFTMGRVGANDVARFTLRRDAVPESVTVFVNGAPSDAAGFDEGRNAIEFAPADHPARGANIRVVYDAVCEAPQEPAGG